MNCGLRVELNPDARARIAPDLSRVSELWSHALTDFGGPFLTGTHFGLVDAMFAPLAFRIQTYDLHLDSEHAHTYAKRILNLNSMKTWYEDALQEPWREPAHEAATLRNGRITQDLRAS